MFCAIQENIVFALAILALTIGFSQHTLTNWLESCGGCCRARKLCSDLSYIRESAALYCCSSSISYTGKHSGNDSLLVMQVAEMTDLFEGSVIRATRRLDELMMQLAKAAGVVGDHGLKDRLEESNATIKRDIMFAASLYL